MAKIELSGNAPESVFARRRLREILFNGVRVTSELQVIEPNMNYVADRATLVDFRIPSDFPVGARFTVMTGMEDGPFRISQSSGQIQYYNGMPTTEGTGGRIETQDISAAMTMRCIAEGRFMTECSEGLFDII